MQSPLKAASFLALLVITLLLTATSWSQDDDQKGGLKFTCYAWDTLPYSEMYYARGNKYLPLEFGMNSRSQIYTLGKGQDFTIFIRSEDPESKEPFTAIGRSAVPKGTKQVLFVVFKRPTKDGLPLSILAIDDDLSEFKPGTFRFMNWTENPVGVTFGRKREIIRPRTHATLASEADANGAFVPFVIHSSNGDRLYETRLIGQTTTRDLVFIMPGQTKHQKASVRFLSETIVTIPEPTE
ncbi:MAG: hypothetical protein ABJQ29_06955 [Luteolibacter sp.]